ncbi:MAG: HTH-type transcriptional regulator NimR [Luteibacter sp.]|uniref:AraC family transcriptional regulator n=1 Tax=Luteibacter sp. TaxID=1886636 RepID=UPI00137CCEF7|nr:helix-turn-helix transcriptional regulator [Luteibacter sp.]KAF1008899.1 MAG: HTH-type transcriptional regulator NimR [Luteibacter sp.]
MAYRESDTIWSTMHRRRRDEACPMPGAVDVLRRAYAAGTVIAEHRHARHQLIYARSGLLVVTSPQGRWIVPSTRALWMPAGTPHSVRCVDAVEERNLYVSPEAASHLPDAVFAVQVGPLLRDLIDAAELIVQPYAEDSRDGRVMRLILDELTSLPTLPLHLPQSSDARIGPICAHLVRHPYDHSTIADWAKRTGVHVKTLQRIFLRDLGMTFTQWRQRCRLLFALERLAVGVPVIDVAMDLGYESPSAFSAMFKRQFGVSPSHYF